MDERELRALQRAAQPVLQRTAPIQAPGKANITPPVLDQIAWGVVLAYVANVSRQPPAGIPQQAKSGEAPLRDEELRAAVDELREAAVRPKLEPGVQAVARFGAAVRRLLESYGWAPPRASQAADELARSLPAATTR